MIPFAYTKFISQSELSERATAVQGRAPITVDNTTDHARLVKETNQLHLELIRRKDLHDAASKAALV